MDMVKIESWDDYLSLPKNSWNIPEPTQDYPRENGTFFYVFRKYLFMCLTLTNIIFFLSTFFCDFPRKIALETLHGLDLIVMPGLAFDRTGTRLGHGRGYMIQHSTTTHRIWLAYCETQDTSTAQNTTNISRFTTFFFSMEQIKTRYYDTYLIKANEYNKSVGRPPVATGTHLQWIGSCPKNAVCFLFAIIDAKLIRPIYPHPICFLSSLLLFH